MPCRGNPSSNNNDRWNVKPNRLGLCDASADRLPFKTHKEKKAANDSTKEELTLKKEKEETKIDRLKKLHQNIPLMIINASSDDSERTWDKVVKNCKRFYECESAGMAHQELTFQFINMGLGKVTFAHGLV